MASARCRLRRRAIDLSPDKLFREQLALIRQYHADHRQAEYQRLDVQCARNARACDRGRAPHGWVMMPPPGDEQARAPAPVFEGTVRPAEPAFERQPQLPRPAFEGDIWPKPSTSEPDVGATHTVAPTLPECPPPDLDDDVVEAYPDPTMPNAMPPESGATASAPWAPAW
ncbi:MAG: hypothetical protein EOO40_01895 [Deltaproteobacteria bacterium]|nr:MAG: hypothetical protein EOO40_01895 [Deltaproteobacteria bacterium]